MLRTHRWSWPVAARCCQLPFLRTHDAPTRAAQPLPGDDSAAALRFSQVGPLRAPLSQPADGHARRPSAVDQAFVDFDAVRYHLSTPDPKQKTVLLLSMDVRCWADLKQHGADAVMQREYAQFLLPQAETEAEYSVSLRIDIAALPESQGASVAWGGGRAPGC